MKNVTKKIFAIFAVLCVASAGFAGCTKNNQKDDSTPSPTISEEDMKYPLQFGSADDGNPLVSGGDDIDLDAEDPTKAAVIDDEPAVQESTEYQDVTDADGEPVTDVQEATDADGAAVTSIVKVTTMIKKPAETKPAATKPAYTPKNDGRYALWMDVSKDDNFYFEGEYIKMTFKVKKDAPDGDYKIRISPDLAGTEPGNPAKVVYPDKVVDGVIRVNNGSIDPVDVSSESGLVLYGDNVAAKQGDTVEYYFYIKNNPGLVAFCNWYYFDSNALEFVDAKACGEYEEIANNTDIGAGEFNKELGK